MFPIRIRIRVVSQGRNWSIDLLARMPGGTLHRRASPCLVGENGLVSDVDRGRLSGLIKRERSAYLARFPGSAEAFSASGRYLLGGVPMTWMRMWPGGFPVYHATASGARLRDIDGNEFIDFCLGDTGAMAGHSPAPVQAAMARRYAELGGATTMLPTQDAEWVAAELARRFGPAHWSFTLTATDANRWAIRKRTPTPTPRYSPTQRTSCSVKRREADLL
jgi:hypothetical protein